MEKFMTLKPCSLCGCQPFVANVHTKKSFLLCCDNCGAKTKPMDNVYDAVVEWNEGRAVKGGVGNG